MPPSDPSSGQTPAPPGDVEAAVDRLFQGPLEEFVTARDRMASELRRAGARDAAARIKALAKPSVSAWAVNQAWWTARERFEALIAAGARLLAAQQASLAGGAADLRDAMHARQRAVEAVVEVAVDALGGPSAVSAPLRQRIASSCDTLATGGVSEDARPGRLTSDVQPRGIAVLSSLLPLSASLPAVEPRAAAPRPAPVPVPATRATGRTAAAAGRTADDKAARVRAEQQARAQEALDAAGRGVAEAERIATAAREDLERAEAAHAIASTHLAEAEDRLIGARQTHAAAQRALGDARRASAQADAARARAVGALDEARQRRDRLEP